MISSRHAVGTAAVRSWCAHQAPGRRRESLRQDPRSASCPRTTRARADSVPEKAAFALRLVCDIGAAARLEFAALRHYLVTDRSAKPLRAASARRTALLLPGCRSLSKPGAFSRAGLLPPPRPTVLAGHRASPCPPFFRSGPRAGFGGDLERRAAAINCVRRQSVSLLPCCSQQRSRDRPGWGTPPRRRRSRAVAYWPSSPV